MCSQKMAITKDGRKSKHCPANTDKSLGPRINVNMNGQRQLISHKPMHVPAPGGGTRSYKFSYGSVRLLNMATRLGKALRDLLFICRDMYESLGNGGLAVSTITSAIVGTRHLR